MKILGIKKYSGHLTYYGILIGIIILGIYLVSGTLSLIQYLVVTSPLVFSTILVILFEFEKKKELEE